MRALLESFVLTTWGVCILGALDSTVIFFLPLAVDLGVVFLASRHPDLFWVYPILVSMTSLIGAAVTFYLGTRIGEAGLERYVPERRLQRVLQRVKTKGAVAIALLDFIPPPFPFTAFILAAGALEVQTTRFFVTLFLVRLVRFGMEAALAAAFGARVIRLIESPIVYWIAEIFTVVIVVVSVISAYKFLRQFKRRTIRAWKS